MNKEACHIRHQLCSDGTLRIWKWPMQYGEDYFGKEVIMTEEKVVLSDGRRSELLAKEERVRAMDHEVQTKAMMCWEVGAPFLTKLEGA